MPGTGRLRIFDQPVFAGAPRRVDVTDVTRRDETGEQLRVTGDELSTGNVEASVDALEGSVLDAEETSSLAFDNDDATLACARVFSIGSPDLLGLITDNVSDELLDDLDETAMLEGVEFFDMPAEDDEADEEAEPQSRGFAPPFEALLGTDFPCNSLLILRFEIDDANPDAAFRVDFEMIPSESDR